MVERLRSKDTTITNDDLLARIDKQMQERLATMQEKLQESRK